MSVTVDIGIESPLWAEADAAQETVSRAVEAAVAACGLAHAEVSVALVDDARMRELNRRWRGQDKPTNVLSFPSPAAAGGGAHFLGDIAVSYETLRREAEAEGKPLLHHLAHLAVHGTLHLSGYDHECDSDAEIMEQRERETLARLGVPDPYAPAAKWAEPA